MLIEKHSVCKIIFCDFSNEKAFMRSGEMKHSYLATKTKKNAVMHSFKIYQP
jgi:hypothetical protein